MKKVLSVLVALMMVFSCAAALAEQPVGTQPMFQLPAFTLDSKMQMDDEALLNLINTMPSEQGGPDLEMIKLLLPFMTDVHEKTVLSNDGFQYEMALRNTPVLNLAVEMTESGFAAGSNVLPSYVLTLKGETITTLMENLIAQSNAETEEALGKLDMELIQLALQKCMGYTMLYLADLQTVVKNGEPAPGEYSYGEIMFNVEIPFTVDIKAGMASTQKYVKNLTEDETINAALNSLAQAIPGLTLNIEGGIEDVPEDQLPTVEGCMYQMLDENGMPLTMDSFTRLEISSQGEKVDVRVFANPSSFDFEMNIPAQEVGIQGTVNIVENGVVCDFVVSAPDFDMEIVGTEANTAEALNIDAVVYVNDFEKPLITFTDTLTYTGERTLTVMDANKEELPLDDLLDAEKSPAVMGTLMGDLLVNGLSAFLNAVAEAVPEQAQTLQLLVSQMMSGFMAGSEPQAAPAAEEPAADKGAAEEAPAESVPDENDEEFSYATVTFDDGALVVAIPVPNGYEVGNDEEASINLVDPETGSSLGFSFYDTESLGIDFTDPESVKDFYKGFVEEDEKEYDFEVNGHPAYETIKAILDDTGLRTESVGRYYRDGIGIKVQFVSYISPDEASAGDTLMIKTAKDWIEKILINDEINF